MTVNTGDNPKSEPLSHLGKAATFPASCEINLHESLILSSECPSHSLLQGSVGVLLSTFKEMFEI